MSNHDAVVFDIETNNLLDKVTKVWVIAAISLDGKKQWVFTDQKTEDTPVDGTLDQGVVFLKNRKKIICHNALGFDYHILEKFWPKLWNRKTVPFKKVCDTFVQSKCQHFDRHHLKGVKSNHSLEYYGVKFGFPKPPIDDWSFWDEAKLNRCLKDIEINRRAFIFLQGEAKKVGIDFTKQIRRTQAAQYWYQKQEESGLYGDQDLMRKYVKELDEKIEELRESIEPQLPPQIKATGAKITWSELSKKWKGFFRKVPADKYDENGKLIKNTIMPVHKIYLANGLYNKSISKHYGIDQDPAATDHFVAGPFTRIDFVPSKMTQHAIVKEFLLSVGWKPTQWNYKKDSNGAIMKDDKYKPIKSSPKLTEDSFDSLEDGVGQRIAEYNTLMHRRRTLLNDKDDEKGWLNQMRPDGRLPAGALAWQTGTGRAAQFNLVNVPSASAVFGAPMRHVWQAPEGKILISVDQDSAQMRLLANFMGDPEYTKAVIEGEEFDADHKYVGTDAHTINAMAFGTLKKELRDKAVKTQDADLIAECSSIRKTGKNGFYCLPMDTQVLTRNGWKHYDDIHEGDTVLGYDEKTQTKKWTKVTGKVFFEEADVYQFGHGQLKMRATADHRWFVKQRVERKGEGFNRSMKIAEHQVRTTSELNSESSIIMNAPMDESCDQDSHDIRNLHAEKWDDTWVQRVLDMSQHERCRFLEGFLLADGYISKPNGRDSEHQTWHWTQNDGDIFEAALLASYLTHDGTLYVSSRKPYNSILKTVKLSKKGYRGFATGSRENIGKEPVFCLSTELGSFVMRQNDTISITGNCMLFGGGDVKMANTLKVKGGAKAGKVIKQAFRNKLRKAGELQDRLVEQWTEYPHAGGGYIQVAGDTWVWCPSEHKLLNYLLMGSEAVVQNEAIIWLNNENERRGLHGAQKMAIHDEITSEYPIEEEKEGKVLMTEMYGHVSKKIGLDVLITGTAQSGQNWLEIH